MTFEVAADAYDRLMGRYSVQLAPPFADFAGVREGMRVLDVGCGPGQLTAELVRRVGAESVAAVDPSESFVAAVRERVPGIDVRQASAAGLPFDDATFDVSLAQLVVHFMENPVEELREIARVTRPGGTVAASVWDFAGGRTPLSHFWRAAVELNPEARDEAPLPGARRGHLVELFEEAGFAGVEETEIRADGEFATFDEWWEPYTQGVGPVGAYTSSLDPEARVALREHARTLVPEAPFRLETYAWAVRGTRV
jgi:SAM-dependent methyltransferase